MVDAAGARQTIGSACIGTVRGDMHDIGKNLVKIMLEGSNIQVYDLGADVPPEEFIHAAREHHCDIIACSALLTTTMQQMPGGGPGPGSRHPGSGVYYGGRCAHQPELLR